MARKINTANKIRELPAYSVPEAAHYLRVPANTLRYWVGRDYYPAIIKPAGTDPLSFSFLNLVELHVLAAIRREHTIPMNKVRNAISYLEENYGVNHPLLSKELQTNGLDLFIEEYGRLININQSGQEAMKEILAAALKRIKRDKFGIPIKLYPYTRSSVDNAPSIVEINPNLSAGRPVIKGTGVATEIIAERYKAGDSIKALAKDYERTAEEIEEAIRCELQIAA